jgi:uncharacterized protein
MMMNMKQALQNALTAAMKAKDEGTKRTLRLVMTTIKFAEIEKGGKIDDQQVLGILQKEVKTRQDAIQEAKQANRTDLIEAAEKEIVILNRFLPKRMDDDELVDLARTVIEEAGASTLRDMGEVMKILMPKVEGRAFGQDVSKIVRELLQN